MSPLSVREAARRLGVSERRVRAMARAGRLPARKVGSSWILDEDLGRRSGAGRPLSARNAWALLALLSGASPEWVHPSVRSRLRRGLWDADWLVRALERSEARSVVHRWRVLPGDLDSIAREVWLVRSGLSANDPALDVVPLSSELDAYVRANSLKKIERRFRPNQSPSNPNLVLRVPSVPWILEQQLAAPAAVVAADLLSSDEPRVARAARRLLRELARG